MFCLLILVIDSLKMNVDLFTVKPSKNSCRLQMNLNKLKIASIMIHGSLTQTFTHNFTLEILRLCYTYSDMKNQSNS